MNDSAFPSPRRRGAPPGNLNALKHGFYSRLFRFISFVDRLRPKRDSVDSTSLVLAELGQG